MKNLSRLLFLFLKFSVFYYTRTADGSSSEFFGENSNSEYFWKKSISGRDFFREFEFYHGEDLAGGFVQFVDESEARQNNMVGEYNGVFFAGAGTMQNTTNGRKSVSLVSRDRYDEGLFVLDVEHMPEGCGVWASFYSTGYDPWPQNGSIEMIQGHNFMENVRASLHTGDFCDMTNVGNPGFNGEWLEGATNCHYKLNFNSGCAVETFNTPYGFNFNRQGGGVFVLEIDPRKYIRMWFFPRRQIPQDIIENRPNPDLWDTQPYAIYPFGPHCDGFKFKGQRFAVTTNFCGDWAGGNFPDQCIQKMNTESNSNDLFGNTYNYRRDNSYDVWTNNPYNYGWDQRSILNSPSEDFSYRVEACKAFVRERPQDFVRAQWKIKSFRIFDKNQPTHLSSPYSPLYPPIHQSIYPPIYPCTTTSTPCPMHPTYPRLGITTSTSIPTTSPINLTEVSEKETLVKFSSSWNFTKLIKHSPCDNSSDNSTDGTLEKNNTGILVTAGGIVITSTNTTENIYGTKSNVSVITGDNLEINTLNKASNSSESGKDTSSSSSSTSTSTLSPTSSEHPGEEKYFTLVSEYEDNGPLLHMKIKKEEEKIRKNLRGEKQLTEQSTVQNSSGKTN